LLKGFRVGRFDHLVLKDNALRVEHVMQVGAFELATGDVGQHHAPAPRHDQLARARRAFALAQQWIFLQHHVDFFDVGVSLLHGVGDGLDATAGMQGDLAVGHALDGGELPVLDLQHEDAATRMQHDEVGVAGFGAYRDVAPAEVVVFQQLFQPLGEAPLASGIELALRPNGEKAGHLYLPW